MAFAGSHSKRLDEAITAKVRICRQNASPHKELQISSLPLRQCDWIMLVAANAFKRDVCIRRESNSCLAI